MCGCRCGCCVELKGALPYVPGPAPTVYCHNVTHLCLWEGVQPVEHSRHGGKRHVRYVHFHYSWFHDCWPNYRCFPRHYHESCCSLALHFSPSTQQGLGQHNMGLWDAHQHLDLASQIDLHCQPYEHANQLGSVLESLHVGDGLTSCNRSRLRSMTTN